VLTYRKKALAMNQEQQKGFASGADAFNRRDFFEAHEIWECVWRGADGPLREFLQGLIQVAVALHHLSRGNLRGAWMLAERAKGHCAGLPSRYCGVDCEDLLEHVDDCIRRGEEMMLARDSAKGRGCLTKQEWSALPWPRLVTECRPDGTPASEGEDRL